jgi:RNA polymerase sigma-70 factor (ECF subfamily)
VEASSLTTQSCRVIKFSPEETKVPTNPSSTTFSETFSETDLIRRAQEGDADAFADLFNRHKGRVYALCLRMTKNTAEAEDLTQDAFLHVFRKLGAFRLDSALSTWLYRVTVNTVLMHFRKKSLRQVSAEKPLSGEERRILTLREFPSIDSRLAGCVDRVALHRALDELPKGYRKVFVLHDMQGFEHREIADFLGCSIGNSKSQLHKARLRLREFLASPEKAENNVSRAARTKVKLTTISQRRGTSPSDGLSLLPAPITMPNQTYAQTA